MLHWYATPFPLSLLFSSTAETRNLWREYRCHHPPLRAGSSHYFSTRTRLQLPRERVRCQCRFHSQTSSHEGEDNLCNGWVKIYLCRNHLCLYALHVGRKTRGLVSILGLETGKDLGSGMFLMKNLFTLVKSIVYLIGLTILYLPSEASKLIFSDMSLTNFAQSS